MPSLLGCKCLLFFARFRLGGLSRLWTQAGSGSSVFPVRSKGRGVRNHFKHSVELVDGEYPALLAEPDAFLRPSLSAASYVCVGQQEVFNSRQHVQFRTAAVIRIEQRGAVAFDQPKLFHLLAHLSHVPAKEACRFRYRPTVVEFVLEVADIGLGPLLA